MKYKYIDNPQFTRRNFGRSFQMPTLPSCPQSHDPQAVVGIPDTSYVAVLSGEREREIFLHYNWLKRKYNRANGRGCGKIKKQIFLLREYLVRMNLPLITKFLGEVRCRQPYLDWNDGYGAAEDTIVAVIDGFDVMRNMKFSTYASVSIIRSLRRTSHATASRSHKYPNVVEIAEVVPHVNDLLPEQLDDGMTMPTQTPIWGETFAAPEDDSLERDDQVNWLREVLSKNLACLSEGELDVLRLRYLHGNMTLEACGQQLGVTKMRIKQREEAALKKLRAYGERAAGGERERT